MWGLARRKSGGTLILTVHYLFFVHLTDKGSHLELPNSEIISDFKVRPPNALMTGVEFGSYRIEESYRAGGIGFLRKPGDPAKNSFINRQIVNNVSFPTFDFF